MKDKSLIRQRFEKSFPTYDDNAFIQKMTAEKLIKLLPRKEYDSVLEIGCATGILTKLIKKNIRFKTYTGNDIVKKSQNYIEKIIPDSKFISGDIETVKIENKYELIISNACIQWCNDFTGICEKLLSCLTPGGILLFSLFGNDNLKEIKEIFKTEDVMPDTENIKSFLKKYPKSKYYEETVITEFNSLTEILKHLKSTGTNAIKPFKMTKGMLAEYDKKYKNLFESNGKVILTYNPVYVYIEK